MDDTELEALRRHSFGAAYRMLGSVSEAEDVAQDALLRLTRHEGHLDEPAAWMTTVATRLSINVLKSARVRREAYVGHGNAVGWNVELDIDLLLRRTEEDADG